ncbi:MAG: hypothetical protein R8G66_24975 [Cytophagales bacterium]|nr:hypothetical protein [Cytophagales bacterium]
MEALQNLAIFFLICQFLSGTLLVIGVQFDEETFKKSSITKHRARPGVFKAARLFSSTSRPFFMAIYLLSLIFVLFSYFAVLLLVGHSIFTLIS